MGQTLKDLTYQDMVRSSIVRRIQGWKNHDRPPFVYALRSDVVANMYRETAKDAPVRHLMVDAAARFGRVEAYEHFRTDSNSPSEFIRDLMVTLGREKGVMEKKEALRIYTNPRLEHGVPPPPPPPLPRPPGAWVSEPQSLRISKPYPFFNAENEFVADSPRSF
jgi:hypothetical protein